jgi:hypothetical protein
MSGATRVRPPRVPRRARSAGRRDADWAAEYAKPRESARAAERPLFARTRLGAGNTCPRNLSPLQGDDCRIGRSSDPLPRAAPLIPPGPHPSRCGGPDEAPTRPGARPGLRAGADSSAAASFLLRVSGPCQVRATPKNAAKQRQLTTSVCAGRSSFRPADQASRERRTRPYKSRFVIADLFRWHHRSRSLATTSSRLTGVGPENLALNALTQYWMKRSNSKITECPPNS